MKTKIILILLLFTSTFYGQGLKEIDPYVSVSAGFDARNTFFGSDATNDKAKLNFIISVKLVSPKRITAELMYENFEAIKYQSLFVNVGKEIDIIRRVVFTPSLGVGLIRRTELTDVVYGEANFFSAQGSGKLMFKLTDKWLVGGRGTLVYRTDKNYLYGGENFVPNFYLEIEFKIN